MDMMFQSLFLRTVSGSIISFDILSHQENKDEDEEKEEEKEEEGGRGARET